MSTYDAAIVELRQMLADTATSKIASRKRLIGAVDGANVHFKTYDKRLVASTVQIFVDEDEVDFDLVDPISGLIDISDAPAINTYVCYTAYWQFWLDTELVNFLNKAAETCSVFNDVLPETAYLGIPPGLKHAALYFACETALSAQINYLINRRHSEEFNLEQDGNDEDGFSKTIQAMQASAKYYFDRAMKLRDDFYMRQGKRNSPAFGFKKGQLRPYGPKR